MSLCVFMLMVAEAMPQTSDALPLIGLSSPPSNSLLPFRGLLLVYNVRGRGECRLLGHCPEFPPPNAREPPANGPLRKCLLPL